MEAIPDPMSLVPDPTGSRTAEEPHIKLAMDSLWSYFDIVTEPRGSIFSGVEHMRFLRSLEAYEDRDLWLPPEDPGGPIQRYDISSLEFRVIIHHLKLLWRTINIFCSNPVELNKLMRTFDESFYDIYVARRERECRDFFASLEIGADEGTPAGYEHMYEMVDILSAYQARASGD